MSISLKAVIPFILLLMIAVLGAYLAFRSGGTAHDALYYRGAQLYYRG